MRQALIPRYRALGFRRHPFGELLLRHDPPRDHTVDPDSPRTELAGQGPGQPLDTRLCRDVRGELEQIDVRADRAEVDDRPATVLAHHRGDGLRREEVM